MAGALLCTCSSRRLDFGICSMFSASMALWAYRSVLTLSSHDRLHGDIVAIMEVLHTPPSASLRSRVSLESLREVRGFPIAMQRAMSRLQKAQYYQCSVAHNCRSQQSLSTNDCLYRYGTCFSLDARAWITRPSVSRLLLIVPASLAVSSRAPDRPMHSLPARSTRVSLPTWYRGTQREEWGYTVTGDSSVATGTQSSWARAEAVSRMIAMSRQSHCVPLRSRHPRCQMLR